MDFPAMTQLISNFGIAIILAAGFLWIAHRFVSKTMPEIAAIHAKTLLQARMDHLNDLMEVRKEFAAALSDQREQVKVTLAVIVTRLEKANEDLSSIRQILSNEKRS